MSRKVVAQERHVAQNDRLFVVLVHYFIYILLLACGSLDPALPLNTERREHAPDEITCAYRLESVLHPDELVIKFDVLASSSMSRHLEDFHFHNLLEPVLGKILGRIHVDADYERTGKLGLETVDLLSCKPHLHAEVVDVHLVVHAFRTDGNYLERVDSIVVRSCDAELCRLVDRLLYLVRICLCWIIKDVCCMSVDECPYSVDARHLFKLCLEGHRTSVAFYRTESVDMDSLQRRLVDKLGHCSVFSHSLDTPFHIDSRKLEPAAGPQSECDKSYGKDSGSVVP